MIPGAARAGPYDPADRGGVGGPAAAPAIH
ncbi:Uncharacterised protein [Bordetella pertussis]|nr:Uncharacterised protein [Bordetella pertussis]